MSTREKVWEPDKEESISYLREMLAHPTNIYGLFGTLLLAALLSFPLGLGFAIIPVLFFAAFEAIAALFIPSSPVFQEMINRKKRRERREKIRSHYVEEIQRREPDGQFHWKAYHRMRERVQSLTEIADNRQTSLSDRDVERLDDATVDYLSLWLAWLVMAERWKNVDEEGIEKRVRAIDKQLEKTTKAVEKKRLTKAKSDLERILKRREGLWGRATEVEAKMLAMTDTLEEVYQRVITNPNSGNAATELQSAVERMRVEEEIDFAVDAELNDLLSGSSKKKKGQQAAAQQARSV
ncbi:MAG: hypothetical protein AAFV53_05195 [Myxococcota bacterium]